MVAAEELDDDALSWNAPSPRLRVLRRYEVLTGTLISIVLAAAVAIVLGAPVVAAGVVVGLAILGSIADLVAGRRVRAWGYAERAEDLLVRRGVMFRRTSVIPYGRMQYVEVTAGPFERGFGLARPSATAWPRRHRRRQSRRC
jgi:hypothetical protein